MKKILLPLLTAGIIFFGAAVAFAQAPPAPEPPEPKPELISVNWDGVDLEQIVKMVASQTNKRFLYDSQKLNLKNRKVYLVSKEIPKRTLFAVFESILEMQNLGINKVIMEDGIEIYKLYESQNLPVEPMPLIAPDETAANIPNTESVVSAVIQLKYVSANNVKQLLLTLVTHPRAVTPLEDANAIIVTDYALNVKRILNIISMVDKKKPDVVFKVIPLEYASPQDVADKVRPVIQSLMRQKGTPQPAGQQETIEVVPDLRTKSIIIVALEERMDQIEKLVKEIDIKVKEEPRNLHVYKLKHAKAKDLAPILNQIYSGPNAPTTVKGPQPAPSPQPGGKPSAEIQPNIIADEQNNTLLIVAEDKAYAELSEVINQLDKRKLQVGIKVHIVEVTGDDTFDFGVELTTIGAPGDSPRGFGLTALGLSTLTDLDGDQIPDARIPGQTTGLTWGVYKDSFEKIPFLAHMSKSESALNVMSIPEVVTNDNSEATLEAAEEEPVATTALPSSVNSPYVSDIRYEKAGIMLKITPHISKNDYLQLDIDQQIEQFGGNRTANLPPPKISRNIKATVTIPNAQTVVLGGLTRNNRRETETGVPFLKDIPWLGSIFKTVSDQQVKTTLYVFITPRILVDDDMKDYLEYSREHQENVYKQTGGKWIGTRPDTLPTSLDIFKFKSPLED